MIHLDPPAGSSVDLLCSLGQALLSPLGRLWGRAHESSTVQRLAECWLMGGTVKVKVGVQR